MLSPKTKQTAVGLFALATIAVVVLAFYVHGAFGRTAKTYHANFPFAGGLESGATVRYLGGPKIGRVDALRVNPQDPTLIDVTFSVESGALVKTDSKVKIMSVSPLGENHLEILPGSPQANPAPEGSFIASESHADFNTLTEQISKVAPQAQELMRTLTDRGTELKVTIERINDLLNAQNRANFSATLSETHGLVKDTRPQVRSVLNHVDDLTQKVGPLVDDFRKTAAKTNEVLNHVDAMIGEDRPEIHQAVIELRAALKSATDLTGQVHQTVDVNSENIDQLLDNMVRVTENLKEFTEKIKSRPNSLVIPSTPREHKYGDRQ
jgi:phospholipid/cholesterol/gamma-HCH transport system substrate-binding protein